MRSFLLEYNKRDVEGQQANNVKIDLHINLWSINTNLSENSTKVFFDFGFMIDDIRAVKSFILYCPFYIDNIKDLGGLLSEKPDLVEAVFNENCQILLKAHPNRTKITKSGDDFRTLNNVKDTFILCKLEEGLINFNNKKEYSRVEINVEHILSGNEDKNENIKDEYKYYFRIRIVPKDSPMSIIKRENDKINILQDISLRTTEVIDFRINDFRSITESMREEVYMLDTFDISSVHYLIMRNSTDEYISSTDKYKSRILEKELWKDYIELNNIDVIAYHFKDTANQLEINEKSSNKMKYISSFRNLSRFKYPLNVGKRICLYLSIIVAISVLSSLIASCIYDLIK